MRIANYLYLILLLIAGCKGIALKNESAVQNKPNVLFIFIDDMRPELKVYGNPIVQAPNLDKLAKQSFVFTRRTLPNPRAVLPVLVYLLAAGPAPP